MPIRDSGPMMQLAMFDTERPMRVVPLQTGLLKWIGNKQRTANKIASYFPANFGTYHEPFLGSGTVLATLAPKHAFSSETRSGRLWKSGKRYMIHRTR